MNILLLLLFTYCNAFLSVYQKNIIRKILLHSNSSIHLKNKSKQILYQEYKPWLKNYVYKFKQNYYPIVKEFVNEDELYFYAIKGYLKSLKNYNGSSMFNSYSEHYVKAELFNGLTDLTPMKPQKRYQTNKFYLNKKNMTKQYFTTKFIGDDEYLLYSNKENSVSLLENDIHILRNIINELPPYYKRLFYLRYDYITLKKKYTLRKIKTLMCIDHETYRQSMIYINEHIKKKHPKPYSFR